MATTSNAAVRPPDAIQVLQLFMSDSLVKFEVTEGDLVFPNSKCSVLDLSHC